MESEKVKEIKDWLENESEVYRNEIAYNTLDLINDLESENKRLSNTEIGELIKENEELAKQCVEWSEINFKKRRQVVELKDRIALLEKDNELLRNAKVVYENVDYCYEDLKKAEKKIALLEKENEILQGTKDRLTFADRIELVNNAVETKLKQFAEMLKEKADGLCIKNDILYAIKSSDIDETLKEFIEND